MHNTIGVQYVAFTAQGRPIIVASVENTYHRLHLSNYFERHRQEQRVPECARIMDPAFDVFLTEREQVFLGSIQMEHDVVDHGWFEVRN